MPNIQASKPLRELAVAAIKASKMKFDMSCDELREMTRET
jgi:hypothetical protein